MAGEDRKGLAELLQAGVWAILLIIELYILQRAAYYFEQTYQNGGVSASSPYHRWIRMTYVTSFLRIILFPTFSFVLTRMDLGHYSLARPTIIRIVLMEIGLRIIWSFTDWSWSGRLAQRMNAQNRLISQNGHSGGIKDD